MKLIYRNTRHSSTLGVFDGEEVEILDHPVDELYPTYLVQAIRSREFFIAWAEELFICPGDAVGAELALVAA